MIIILREPLRWACRVRLGSRSRTWISEQSLFGSISFVFFYAEAKIHSERDACQTRIPVRESELCCPQALGAVLGWKTAMQPARSLGSGGHFHKKDHKGSTREEGWHTEREIRKGFPMGLGTRSSWKTLAKVWQRRAGSFRVGSRVWR